MGFYLDKNRALIELLLTIDKDATMVDKLDTLTNLKRLRRAYIQLNQESHVLANRVYHRMKEIKKEKREKVETDIDNDDDI